MIPKILTIFLAIALSVATALSQTGFSESTPYKSRPIAKSDRSTNVDKSSKAEQTGPVSAINETIAIPIAVYDKEDSIVRDIVKQEVTIFANDFEVPVLSFEKQTAPLNVVLVLDTSPSANRRLDTIKQHALRLVNALPPNTRIMVVEFHSNMNIVSQMTGDRAAAEKAIKKAKMGDGTSIYSAVATLFQKVFPLVPGHKNVILLTDGVDTTSKKANYSSSLFEVERSDVSIYPVLYETMNDNPARSGLSQDWIAEILRQSGRGVPRGALPGGSAKEYQIGREYLNDLARISGGRVIPADKFDERIGSLGAELQGKYYATVTIPRGAAASRPLKVRINRPRLKVYARGSFITN